MKKEKLILYLPLWKWHMLQLPRLLCNAFIAGIYIYTFGTVADAVQMVWNLCVWQPTLRPLNIHPFVGHYGDWMLLLLSCLHNVLYCTVLYCILVYCVIAILMFSSSHSASELLRIKFVSMILNICSFTGLSSHYNENTM